MSASTHLFNQSWLSLMGPGVEPQLTEDNRPKSPPKDSNNMQREQAHTYIHVCCIYIYIYVYIYIYMYITYTYIYIYIYI